MKKLVTDRLRAQVGQPAGRVSLDTHPDADTLSAFGELALPEVERKRVLEHVSSCSECRDTLYLSSPSLEEAQRTLAIRPRRMPVFALRWGTLAAALAIGVVMLLSIRKHNENALYRPREVSKASPEKSAELKTPADIAEMRALRDDRSLGKRTDKLIPAPKRMTAHPAANFEIAETGEVRMTPRAGAKQQNNAPSQEATFTALNNLDSAEKAGTGRAVGGALQANNALAGRIRSNEVRGGVAGAPGVVAGTIVDPSGAVIPNATVTVTGPVGTRALQSDGQGQFSFDRLTPGAYSVTAQAQGFQTAELRQIAVAANQAANLQLKLQAGATSEVVAVSGQQVEVTNSVQLAQSQLKKKAVPSVAAENTKTSPSLASGNSRAESTEKDEMVSRNSVSFASPASAPASVQWTLSPDGGVERSFDNGITWQTVAIGGASRFRALSSAGSDIWAGGDAGALFHSADAGQTWERITPAASGQRLELNIARVEFVDAFHGTVTATSGQTWTTYDGGQTWTVK